MILKQINIAENADKHTPVAADVITTLPPAANDDDDDDDDDDADNDDDEYRWWSWMPRQDSQTVNGESSLTPRTTSTSTNYKSTGTTSKLTRTSGGGLPPTSTTSSPTTSVSAVSPQKNTTCECDGQHSQLALNDTKGR